VIRTVSMPTTVAQQQVLLQALTSDYCDMLRLQASIERRHAEHLREQSECNCWVHTITSDLSVAIREVRKEAWACCKVRL
jgi:hypothetical protein